MEEEKARMVELLTEVHYRYYNSPQFDIGEEVVRDRIRRMLDVCPHMLSSLIDKVPRYLVSWPSRDTGEEEPDQRGSPVRPEIVSPWYRELLKKTVGLAPECSRHINNFKEFIMNANRESGLPTFSRPDLRDTSPRFIPHLCDSVLNIPPTYNRGLLLLSGGYLTSHMQNTTAPYQYFQLLEKTTEAPPQPLMLTLGEACDAFSREMTDMTKFLLGYFLCLLLLYPLHRGVQIVGLLVWVLIPFTYFPDLIRNSSRSGVTIGTFKLAPLSFTSLGAVGISTICVAATMLLLFIKFRLSNRNPRVVEDVDVNLNGLAEVLEG